jgi:HD superfamily phosphohydrolase YqeK
LAEEAGIELSDPCEQHPAYLHALTGAYLVSKEFGIDDPLILDTIAAHSFAGNSHNFNAPFSQCIQFADILAPTKAWKGIKKLHSIV